MRDYVNFEGDENEKKFLDKCLQQWDISSEKSPVIAMLEMGAMFSEMRSRLEELEEN